MTALRKQFLQDLQLAGLAERTCEAYVRVVPQLARRYRQSTDSLGEAQVRDFFSHLHLTRHGEEHAHAQIDALMAAPPAPTRHPKLDERKALSPRGDPR